MVVRNLSQHSFEEILECFLLAFEDYFVPMPTDPDYYKARWKASKVDFSSSYGLFDEGRLVAFILHSIDTRFGQRMAYNSGTGVIPAYRSRGLTAELYAHALTELRTKGIQKSTLEVITENERAIRAYTGVGFKKVKHYRCFKAELKGAESIDFELQALNWDEVDWESLSDQELYSWDNQKESIIEGNYRFYQVKYRDKVESYFILLPTSGYVAQLGLLKTSASWSRLFTALQSVCREVRMNNVDLRSQEKCLALQEAGWIATVDQFEMELNLS